MPLFHKWDLLMAIDFKINARNIAQFGFKLCCIILLMQRSKNNRKCKSFQMISTLILKIIVLILKFVYYKNRIKECIFPQKRNLENNPDLFWIGFKSTRGFLQMRLELETIVQITVKKESGLSKCFHRENLNEIHKRKMEIFHVSMNFRQIGGWEEWKMKVKAILPDKL